MSTAFYPQGSASYGNVLPQGGYKTWKGRGIYSNPTGIISGNIRPLTNNDPLNNAIYKQGATRPLKLYRYGISVPIKPYSGETNEQIVQNNYYSNREVKSSIGATSIALTIDQPGRVTIKDNSLESATSNDINLLNACKDCNGIGIISNWYPINDLSEKPQPNVTNPLLCCNQQQKALKRVLPASTILKKNYYTTTYQYLYNRCQTYDQRVFNFVKSYTDTALINNSNITNNSVVAAKPGSALATYNLYVANCNPNGEITSSFAQDILNIVINKLLTNNLINEAEYNQYLSSNITNIPNLFSFLDTLSKEPKEKKIIIDYAVKILYDPYSGALIEGPSNPKGCSYVSYKPNNPQFAQQGAVSSSTRTLKASVDTIELNAASIRKGTAANINLLKNKAPACNPGNYFRMGNPRTCNSLTNDISVYKLGKFYSFNSNANQLFDLT